ncbi:MAG: HAMP domain-containing histidine kinase [Synergistaceae bacterium]|nr:HAMP domain-containing histidine kinase [Synergistaceae bacterium]
MMRNKSLRTHFMLLYFVLSIVAGIIVPFLGVKLSVEAFRNYQIQRRKADLENLGDSLSALYFEEGGVWERRRVMDVLRPAPQWGGMTISLIDSSGNEVYTLKPPSILRSSHSNSNPNAKKSSASGRTSHPKTEHITIKLAGNSGRLEIERRLPSGRYEMSFISYLISYTLACALVVIVLACGTGYFVAGKLSRPVTLAIERTKRISKGDYDVHCEAEHTGIRELDALTKVVGELGRSLEGQEKLRRRLMVDVAHELRTPLTAARTQIEAIADGILEPTPERLNLCVNEMNRLAELIKNVDDLSRLEGETLGIHTEITDMKKFLSAVVESFTPLFEKSGITLSAELRDAVCEIDRDNFRHVTDNLLSNAIRYTDKGGKVSVKLYTQGDEAVIEVADTGIGIAAEDLPNIFERFWRADESRTRVTGGSGVGLAIVKASIEAHGGKISAQSTKGKGSCFTVRLKRA